MERKYQFRETLKEVHKKNVRCFNTIATPCEFEISDCCVISIPNNSGRVLASAAMDFVDYLFTSMNISARIGREGFIDIEIKPENPEKVTEFEITIDEKIHILAADERSAAQALYYLEDLMNERKAPFIKKGKISKNLQFSPRITYSTGFGRGARIPEQFFALIAHHGFNAVLMGNGLLDLNFQYNLDNALKWGLDVYICSNILSKYHPDDPQAKEYYNNTYGKFIKTYPEIKGIILVGEAIGFPSKDTNSSGNHRSKSADNIPLTKIDTGFYPCEDYYTLVNIVKESVRPYNKDIDIVLWTYNWWSEEMLHKSGAIRKMIELLPTDISLMVSFDVSDQYTMDGVTKFVCDYSIATPGPSDTFKFEAQLAKEKGIRLYSHVSTSGSTWDFGVIPYMPMPQKWIKRYKAIYEAQEKYGLRGFIENWTPGFYPSIVSELTKKCYFDKGSDFDENLRIILKSHFGETAETVYKALDLWSEASDYIHSTYDNQYGPLRVGTAFPFYLNSQIKSPFSSPWSDFSHSGQPNLFNTLYSVRIDTDRKHWEKVAELMKEGVDLLNSIENPSEELLRLENLGRYIYHCTTTVINIHRWHKHRDLLKVLDNKNEIIKSIEELRKIGADEKYNALESIKCLRKDSKLGFENVDGYVGGEEAVMWKIKQLDYSVNVELERYVTELPL